jgi:hypothetical protein
MRYIFTLRYTGFSFYTNPSTYENRHSSEDSVYRAEGTQVLSIRASDGANQSRDIYHLSIPDEYFARLWAVIDSERFCLTIGNLGLFISWNSVYGGMLMDAYDNESWGIGYGDFRLRLHEIYRAAHDNALWDVVGRRFRTLSITDSVNLTNLTTADNIYDNQFHQCPNHGLTDYFTTYLENAASTGSEATVIPESLSAPGQGIRSFYPQGANNPLTNCAILMPAFYLEGRANSSNYGSANATALGPQLYYRGNLPYLWCGGAYLPAGTLFEYENQVFIKAGWTGKLMMRIS